MKKFAIIILLLMCTDVIAAWSKLEDAQVKGVTVYADIGKIHNKGISKVKMRHMLNFHSKDVANTGRAYQSVKAFVEYNCDEEHYRVLASSMHTGPMGTGKVVRFVSDAKYWEPVESNTLEETLWKLACDKRSITRHD